MPVKHKEHRSSCATKRGKTLLTIGQDLFSIDEYVQGQYNASLHSGSEAKRTSFHPAATMFYTDIQTLRGLEKPVDYGSGIEYAGGLADLFPNSGIQVGLWLNGTAGCQDIVDGRLQANVDALFASLKSLKVPKIFLRVGYEFDNPSFGYSSDPSLYKHAFRKMVKDCEKHLGHRACHEKVAFCWHSWAAPKVHPLDHFYPGDDFVDWIGVSIFQQLYPWAVDSEEAGAFAGGTRAQVMEVLEFAKAHSKPTMIAESTPFGGIHGEDFGLIFGNATEEFDTDRGWKLWFEPVLDIIEEYDIGMWSYINCDWDVQPMWAHIGFGDTRISSSKEIMEAWRIHVIDNPRFVTSLECDHHSSHNQLSVFEAAQMTVAQRSSRSIYFNTMEFQHASSASKLIFFLFISAVTFFIYHRQASSRTRELPRRQLSEVQMKDSSRTKRELETSISGYGSIN